MEIFLLLIVCEIASSTVNLRNSVYRRIDSSSVFRHSSSRTAVRISSSFRSSREIAATGLFTTENFEYSSGLMRGTAFRQKVLPWQYQIHLSLH